MSFTRWSKSEPGTKGRILSLALMGTRERKTNRWEKVKCGMDGGKLRSPMTWSKVRPWALCRVEAQARVTGKSMGNHEKRPHPGTNDVTTLSAFCALRGMTTRSATREMPAKSRTRASRSPASYKN